jgi:hypothetical protein
MNYDEIEAIHPLNYNSNGRNSILNFFGGSGFEY